MEKQDVVNKLTEIFRKIFSNGNLVLNDSLTAKDVEQWDSLSHMLLISEIESEFGIKFKLKELNQMQNVGDMIRLVSYKIMNN